MTQRLSVLADREKPAENSGRNRGREKPWTDNAFS
jgi:hypothetical protein